MLLGKAIAHVVPWRGRRGLKGTAILRREDCRLVCQEWLAPWLRHSAYLEEDSGGAECFLFQERGVPVARLCSSHGRTPCK